MKTTLTISTFLLLFLLGLFLSTNIMRNTNVADEQIDVSALAVKFKELRNKKGHWEGEAFNHDTDAFHGAKHNTMLSLAEKVAYPGQDVHTVLEVFGIADEVRQTKPSHSASAEALPLMPGIMTSQEMNPANSEEKAYLIYYWRFKHDYLWIETSVADNKVIKSEWYHAGE